MAQEESEKGLRPLQLRLMSNKVAPVEILLQLGAEVNLPDKTGQPPLFQARDVNCVSFCWEPTGGARAAGILSMVNFIRSTFRTAVGRAKGSTQILPQKNIEK